jgi:hypothetical protein
MFGGSTALMTAAVADVIKLNMRRRTGSGSGDGPAT